MKTIKELEAAIGRKLYRERFHQDLTKRLKALRREYKGRETGLCWEIDIDIKTGGKSTPWVLTLPNLPHGSTPSAQEGSGNQAAA